jgi:hypothetical protein
LFLPVAKEEDNNSNNTNPSGLTEQEKEDLLILREEEKLARDVYLYSYEKYGLNVFNNIGRSEQMHMDEVLDILEAYGIDDPAHADTGVFNNTDLQALYNTLTAQSDQSLLDALLVGATIEDLDIADIADFEDNTTKEDLLDMYGKLKCGSRNHMRSFYNQISGMGGTYTPQYITQALFDDIINSAKEACNR